MQDDAPIMPVEAKPFVSVSIGLAWIVLYIVLIAPVFLFSAFGGERLGRVTWPGISPLFHGIVWIAGVLLITWLVRVKLNKRSWSGMALPRLQLSRLALGGFAGLSLILIIAAIEYELGWLHFVRIDTSMHRGVSKVLWAILCLTPSLGVGVSEELGFRGYVFQTLGERMPVWVAALLMSIIFGLLHFTLSGFNAAFVISVMTISLMFLSFRFATGTLWFAIGFHGAWDWTETYLVGLSTTGGGYDPALIQITQTGPAFWVGSQQATESGALFILIVLCVLAIAITYATAVGRLPPLTRQLGAQRVAPMQAPQLTG
ncbi:MAG TPA: type II CAAX endopeptidase family protein [Steroidobacteraceae bacterium]|nr:type II CAAX endopeptidase family protein [Steroidobacteraceae bacterium]